MNLKDALIELQRSGRKLLLIITQLHRGKSVFKLYLVVNDGPAVSLLVEGEGGVFPRDRAVQENEVRVLTSADDKLKSER